MKDRYDNTLTTTRPAARDHYVAGVDLLLAGEAGLVPAFERAIAADPGFALGYAGLARGCQFSGDMPAAKAAMAEARTRATGLTPRERSHINAMGLLIDANPQAYAKSGTTWLQQIVSQLIFNGEAGLDVAKMSPWIDLRIPPKEVKLPMVEAQTHRRFIKTHLPVDALVFSQKAKYIYIARDGRDVVWSLYNHHANANDAWYGALNDSPGRIGPSVDRPTDDIVQYFREWLEQDGYPFWSFWENIRSWHAIRDLPNVHMLHFQMLKQDMPGEIRRIANFLEIEIDESRWGAILEHCSFDYMKKNAVKSVPLGGVFWDGGADTFIHKGVDGRWRDILPQEDKARYEAKALDELGPDCSRWLAVGA